MILPNLPLPAPAALACALLLSSAAQRPAPPDEPAPEAAAEDAERLAKDLRRVLTLVDGTRLRGRARCVDGRWECRERGAWVPLEPGVVAEHVEERALLAEAARLAEEVERDDAVCRAALADWMLRRGLEDEALRELDRALRAAPDCDPALSTIARALRAGDLAHTLATLPSDLGGLLAHGAAARPAEREIVVRRLGDLLEDEPLEQVLRAELGRFQSKRRAFAAHVLRRTLPGRAVRPLIDRCALDPSSTVRRSAALALRDTGEEGMVLPLTRALGSASAAVRTNAAESLGHMGFRAAVPALVNRLSAMTAAGGDGLRPPAAHIHLGKQFAYVGDYDLEIAQAASIADPVVMVGEEAVVLDARVYGAQIYTVQNEIRSLGDALERLTGMDVWRDARRWERWVEENRAALEGGEGSRSNGGV